MNAGQEARELAKELASSAEVLHFGLEGLMQLLAGDEADRSVGCGYLRTLLAPLAGEARQAWTSSSRLEGVLPEATGGAA